MPPEAPASPRINLRRQSGRRVPDCHDAHLAEIARTVAPGAHAVLVRDGAGWHGGHDLSLPDNVALVTLPPCSPEPNPVGNAWQSLRANGLSISVRDDGDAIVDARRIAWNRFADNPDRVASITARQWAEINP